MAELSKNKKMLADLIDMWLTENLYLESINHELYIHTELFENGFERNFDEQLHNFFAKKITRFKRDTNELLDILPPKILEKINERRK